jgi:hypothetical protein
VGTAKATVITGSVYEVPEATSQNAVPANIPAGPADVTFDVNSPLNFNATGATIGAWLASGGAFNIVDIGGVLGDLMDDGTHGVFVVFTGLVTVLTGQTFTVTHDDGLTLIIGGIDLASILGRRHRLQRRRLTPVQRVRLRSSSCTANAAGGQQCFRSICPLATSPNPQPSPYSASASPASASCDVGG